MSTPSFEKINYALRPAKNIERKMIVESLGCLKAFNTLDSYRYIGFGSPYFSDFSLVHRALGIRNMVCIERESGKVDRFEFNRPFNCIELKFGLSSDLHFSWEEIPTIIWLDYDDPIDLTILSDIDVVCSSFATGSFLLVTVRNRADDFGENPPERLKHLKSKLGIDKLPANITPAAATSANFGNLLWQIIDSEIRFVVSERSAGLKKSFRLNYEQVLHFIYKDGVQMLTLGGVFYRNGQRIHFAQCDFPSLPFYRNCGDTYRIKVPPLTFREMRALDAQLPETNPEISGVPASQIQQYAEHYRYFPNYVEAEM